MGLYNLSVLKLIKCTFKYLANYGYMTACVIDRARFEWPIRIDF